PPDLINCIERLRREGFLDKKNSHQGCPPIASDTPEDCKPLLRCQTCHVSRVHRKAVRSGGSGKFLYVDKPEIFQLRFSRSACAPCVRLPFVIIDIGNCTSTCVGPIWPAPKLFSKTARPSTLSAWVSPAVKSYDIAPVSEM